MMQPVLVRLTAGDKLLLEREAKKQRQSVSEILRRAIKVYLKKQPRQTDGVEVLLSWTKQHTYSPDSTKPKNVSSVYKKYLYNKSS